MATVPDKSLLPANVTLLQPGSRAYRLYDALNYGQVNAQALQKQVTYLNGQIATIQSQIATIQSQITALQNEDVNLQNQINSLSSTTTSLQNQINVINTRLANAGIP